MDWQFPQEVADAILERIPEESLRSILKTAGMPTRQAVYRRVDNDPDFARDFNRAMADRADADAEQVKEYEREDRRILRELRKGKLDPKTGRAMIQANREAAQKAMWSAGVRKPKVYGQRMNLDHDVSGTLAEELKAARERASKDR